MKIRKQKLKNDYRLKDSFYAWLLTTMVKSVNLKNEKELQGYFRKIGKIAKHLDECFTKQRRKHRGIR
jgi:hypothetical protein